MNLASWIILGIVVLVVALAIRATFFKKDRKGGGCDPGDESTDHTREYTPLLVLGDGIKPTCLGTRKSFADIAATAAEAFGVRADIAGESFLADITEVRYE
jgi:hypothetical protein